MIRFDLHPEDLLERAARGPLSSADSLRLQQHLAECAACRVERAMSVQAALDAAPRRDEKLLVARLKRELGARLALPDGGRARRKGALAATMVAVVAVASVAVAATLVIVRPGSGSGTGTEAGAPTPAPAAHAPSARAPDHVSPDDEAPSDLHKAPPSVAEERSATEERSVTEERQNVPGRARSAIASVEPDSASELFSRANQARRDGKVSEAVRLYHTLQERFAGTSEELVSRVTLGRLLLDRLGDSRGALVQFNSYLASPGRGALREEAMVGRALALGRMGRAPEERAAWRALLDAWPKSAHRKRAEARLAELVPVAADAPGAGSGVVRSGGVGSGPSGGGRSQ